MFQNIVGRSAHASSGSGNPGTSAASIELVKDVAKIQTMLEREGATLAEAYSYFEDKVYPQMTQAGVSVPQMIRNQVGTVLLDKLALEKPRDFESNTLPSVTRITEIMIALDVLRPAAWATLVIELIQHIYRQNTVPDAYDSIKDYETAMARRDGLLHDLLGAWGAFCAQRVSDEADLSTRPPATNKSPRAGAKPRQQTTLQKGFGAMFPQYLVPSLLRPTFAAFATYKLLTDAFNRSRATTEEAAPFLQMMKGLIFQTRSPRREDFKAIFDKFPDLSEFVWPKTQAKDKGILGSASVFGDKPGQLKANIHRQVGEALKIRNLGAVRKAWSNFWGDKPEPDPARLDELRQCPEMFDYFIMAYSMIRQPQLAIEVWNKMERIGIKPTIKTWNSMLQGCSKAANANGVRTVWSKLLTSGFQLDTTIWTSRINGLFLSGEADAGLRALDEMAKVWAARADPRFAKIAVQPSVEPVNAALSGLLRLKRESDATNVLAWAAKQGINPDIYTFNILLRPLIRRGDMNGIDNIFATMRSVNIQADVATFTILLEGSLNHIGGLPPAQQVALVERILAAMKASGVEINMQVYAKILYILLCEGDRAEEPVKAVLAHIWHRGLELSSHIYTMLAEHYFSRSPPDTDAVTALIENRRLHANKGIDRVFWERVMKGYCQAGDLQRALGIFDRVFVTGTTVTFATLYELLRPLVDAGDMQAAARVVEAARRIGKPEEAAAGAGAGGEGKRYWRHRFWHLAYEQGLMGEQLAQRFREANQ